MRVLRCSYFTGPKEPPTIAIVRDCDVQDTLESIAINAVRTFNSGLVTYDIFDMPDAEVPEATLEAGNRTDPRQEEHMATLYFYLSGIWEHGLPHDGRKPNPGARMDGDRPMPLSTEQVRFVFEQLAQHPLYNDFTLSYPDRDGRFVTLSHGVLQ